MNYHQKELDVLDRHYSNSQNEIVVLYGNGQNGVHQTMLQFLKNKSYFYYYARSCSSKLQLQFFYDEIREGLPKGMSYQVRYSDIISAMLSVPCAKRIIVIDEFHRILKSSPEFMDEMIHTIHNKWNHQKLMFLLVSTSCDYIEDNMISQLKNLAYEINGIVKVNDLKFSDLQKYFPEYDMISQVELLSVFGPYFNNWSRLDLHLGLAENICKHVLTPGSYFYERGVHILPSELREPAVYNTILETLASGKKKLNDLFQITGFERAKISVYLKNLAALKIVEKMESFETQDREQMLKGIYQITDPFTRFWYCFVYPHFSKLQLLEPEKFYRKYIENNLRAFAGGTYVAVCREYLERITATDQLPFKIERIGTWYGKVGTIDLIAQDEKGNHMICLCNFEKAKMSYGDYEWNNYCIDLAKLHFDRLILFSRSSFDEKLKKEALHNEKVILLDGDKFTINSLHGKINR